MFDRWRQENFFKYLREEFALDALVDDDTEPADATRDVPNPERSKINAQLRKANAQLEQLQAHLGYAAFENREDQRRTMRGFKIANAAISARVRTALRRITELEKQRATIPARVPVQEVVEADVIKLAVERKHASSQTIRPLVARAVCPGRRHLPLTCSRHLNVDPHQPMITGARLAFDQTPQRTVSRGSKHARIPHRQIVAR